MRFRGILNDVYGQVLRACASWGFNFKIRTDVQHEGVSVQHVFIFLYGRITKNIRPYYERIHSDYAIAMRTLNLNFYQQFRCKEYSYLIYVRGVRGS